MSELCVTLLCPPVIEERLLDMLLMSSSVEVFTSTATAAHGLDREQLNPMEQVLGRGRAVHIQVIIPEIEKSVFFDVLRRQFPGAGLRYWVTPVSDAGEIA